MLKALGMLLLLAVCTLAGLCFSVRLKARQRRLAALCLFIEELSDGIRTGQGLKELIGDCGEKAGITFEEFRVRLSPENLQREDISLLESFFSQLGMGDAESQIKRCETYLALLKRQENAAAEQVRLKAPLYGRLGFFAGLFLAVMFI